MGLLASLLPPTCPSCGAPGAAPCAACLGRLRPAPVVTPPPAIDAWWGLLAYEDEGRELVARLKYRSNRAGLAGLAAAAAALVTEPVDLVTWAPTTPARRRARGFDHAELLAGAVARRLGVPRIGMLRRLPGPQQTGAPRAARLLGPGFRPARAADGRRVLLVDDVVTTGATATAAALALRTGGAAWVGVLVLSFCPSRPLHTVTIRGA